MLWWIIGAAIGSAWGWPYALLGFGIGLIVSLMFSGSSVSEEVGTHRATDQEDDYNYSSAFSDANIPILSTSDAITSVDMIESDHGIGGMLDKPTINPANGLPMAGGVDIEGNPYGTDLNHDMDYSTDDTNNIGIDTSIDDSFSAFDDSYGTGFDDTFDSTFDDHY